MRISTIDSVATSQNSLTNDFRIEQRACASSAIVFLLVLVPALTAAIAPIISLCSLAVSDSGIRSALLEKSNSAVLVFLGLGLWAALWGVPAWRFLGQLGAKRQVEIVDGRVGVTDKSLFRKRSWSCLLNEFNGISHNVRTTLAGARHELILVHEDPAKSVLVHMAPMICEAETLKFSRFFRQQMTSKYVLSNSGNAELDNVAPQLVGDLEPMAA